MSEDTRLKGICYEMYLCVLYGECKTIADLEAKYEDLIVNYDENNPPSHEDDTEKYFYPSVKLRLKSMCYELFLAIRSDNQDIIQDLKDEFDYLVRKYYSRVPSGGGSGGITNHEELENLMGGNSSGHYHLTEAELETVRHGGGGSSVEVVNNYTTTTTGKALDAVKGKDLNERVTVLENADTVEIVNNLNETTSGKALDALQGKLLNDRVVVLENADTVEVVNNYTTTTTGKALDAVKGKDLNERVTVLENADTVEIANNITTTTTGKALDAYQGKVLADRITALENSSGGGGGSVDAIQIFREYAQSYSGYNEYDIEYNDYPFNLLMQKYLTYNSSWGAGEIRDVLGLQ